MSHRICVFSHMRIILGILLILSIGCERHLVDPEALAFKLESKYDMIRSYPGSGGIFLVQVIPDEGFSGEIEFSVDADPRLNAEILENPLVLDDTIHVAEICIWPDTTIPIDNYEILLVAAHGKSVTKTIRLQVEMVEWEAFPPSEDALMIRDTFISWLIQNVPQCAQLADQAWRSYMTYPQILVVEHWTSISPDWELRFCFHVMIAPYDWSMVWLRPRGKTEPIITAKRESSGDIHTIPAEEYPLFEY